MTDALNTAREALEDDANYLRALSDTLKGRMMAGAHPEIAADVLAVANRLSALSAAEAPPSQTSEHPEAGALSREASWTDEAREHLKAAFVAGCCAVLTWTKSGMPQDDLDEAGYDYASSVLPVNATPPALKASELGEDHSSVGIKPSPTDEGRAVAPTSEWYRDGRMLYTLEQHGWYRGKPEMRNRLTVVVGGGPGATEAEMDTLTDLLLDLLPAASVAPEARATSPCNLSAEGRSEVGEAEPSRPTEPFPVPLSTISEGWRPEDGFKIGQPVEVADGYAYQEWRRIPLFICEVKARIGSAELSYSVSENWPPKGLGDITTDFAEIDLQPRNPAPAQDAEGEG